MVSRVLRSFRFDLKIYEDFGRLASEGGCSVTEALERFMDCCVQSGVLVFPEGKVEDFEVEARILVDWLGKGRRTFRGQGGEEVVVSGRLLWLLPRVRDTALRGMMEEQLKKSVSQQG